MISIVARTVCGSVLLCSFWAGFATADDSIVAELYGSGVHHYFAGDYAQAAADLSAAIDGGTKDPRAFYFRSLAEMKLGQKAAAEADMQKGAALESADINQYYPVGKSLERVQGSTRTVIERHRSLARAEIHRRQRDRDAVRYEQLRRAEDKVLRNPEFTPMPTEVAPPKPSAPKPESEDPFDDSDKKADAADETGDAEEMPAEKAGAGDEMPADEKEEAATGDGEAAGAAEGEAAKAAASKEADPKDELEDPFDDSK